MFLLQVIFLSHFVGGLSNAINSPILYILDSFLLYSAASLVNLCYLMFSFSFYLILSYSFSNQPVLSSCILYYFTLSQSNPTYSGLPCLVLFILPRPMSSYLVFSIAYFNSSYPNLGFSYSNVSLPNLYCFLLYSVLFYPLLPNSNLFHFSISDRIIFIFLIFSIFCSFCFAFFVLFPFLISASYLALSFFSAFLLSSMRCFSVGFLFFSYLFLSALHLQFR